MVCVGVERSVESCEDVNGCVVVYLLVSVVPPFPFTGRVMREREPGRRARPRDRAPAVSLRRAARAAPARAALCVARTGTFAAACTP